MAHHLDAECRRHGQPDLVGLLHAWQNRCNMIDRLGAWQSRQTWQPKPPRWSDGRPAKPRIMPIDAPPPLPPPSEIKAVLWSLVAAVAFGGAILALVGYANVWIPRVNAVLEGWGR